MSNLQPRPSWWDPDLHGACLQVLTDEWQSMSEIKAQLGEYSSRAYEILRDLIALGLVDVQLEISAKPAAIYTGCRTSYKLIRGAAHEIIQTSIPG